MTSTLTIYGNESELDILYADLFSETETQGDLEHLPRSGDANTSFGMPLEGGQISLVVRSITAISRICIALTKLFKKRPSTVIKISCGKNKYEVHGNLRADELEKILDKLLSHDN